MNNKNTFAKKAALVCLLAAISACDSSDQTVANNGSKSLLDADPAALPRTNLLARWSADSLSLTDGDAVDRWPDGSGNHFDAMSSSIRRPIYKVVDGVPLVHFDGVDDYLTAGAASDWSFLNDGSEWTVFVVFRSAGADAGGKYVLLDSGGANPYGRGFTLSYDDRPATRRTDAVNLSIADGKPDAFALSMATGNRNFAPGKWGIISATFKPLPPPDNPDDAPDRKLGEAKLFVNGYQRVVSDIPMPSSYRSRAQSELNIGKHGFGSESAHGDIREILLYDRALSEPEQVKTIQALAAKLKPAVRIRAPLSKRWLNFNPEQYQAFGIAFRIPSTGKLIAIQRQGVSHVGESVGEIRQWESTDRGVTWTDRSTYDSEYDDRNVGGGLVSRTGSILVLLARYSGINSIDMRVLRSVDEGQTFTDTYATLPTNGCSSFSPYGPIAELPSGRLFQTFYGDGCPGRKVWISESTDDGLTWTFKTDIYRGTLDVNETSLAWVSGADDATSTLIAVSRHDGGTGLLQFASTDGGDTWTNQGVVPGGNRTDVSPWLYRLSDGTLVNAWHERSWFTFRIRVAQGSAAAASPSNWSPSQVTYRAVTRVVGDSGYPALLSTTEWDDDLIEVLYDNAAGKANLLVNPVFLP